MKTVLWCYLLVCCGAAESFTEKSVDLGQNVTLKCEVSVRDVYWFLMKPSEPPVFILRSFESSIHEPEYSHSAFSKTFSLQYNSSLFIHNISTNELGVYYCIKTQTTSPPDISRGIRLYIQNHSAENQTCTPKTKQAVKETSLWTIFIISVILNCVLAGIITAFLVLHCKKPLRAQAQPPVPGVLPHQDIANPVYSEVQHTMTTRPVKKSDHNSTYALLRPPNP
ncbi:uncharacterized protein Hap1MRO34_002933 isoform 1-T5 [Clarias gariepinus]